MEKLAQDLRHTFRSLSRSPGFTLAAVLTLGLGIGANAAIFSIADHVLLRRPPVAQADRLATLYTTCRRGFPRCSSSFPDYLDYRDRSRSFADIAGHKSVSLNVGGTETARLVIGQLVTGNYFGLLGVNPYLGRTIQRDDDRPGAPEVAVLSFDLWNDAFGRDTTVIGRTVRLNGTPFTVIGVAPRGFRGLAVGSRTDAWVPLHSAPLLGPAVGSASNSEIFSMRGARWIDGLIGRLTPDATVEAARTEMVEIARQLAEEYPEDWQAMQGYRTITVDGMSGYILPVLNAADLKRFVWILFGVVGTTLLLASANVANLLLARATARKREIGVRIAIGAPRGRLIRQLLTESTTLALAGGTVGLLFASWMLEALGAFELPGGIAIASLGVGLDGRILAFALALSLATSLAFGLLPALQATHPAVVSSLKGESTGRAGGQHRMRKVLVAAQVALCLILLVGSGLFLRTLRNSLRYDLGFDAENVAVARFNLAFLRYTPEQGAAFVDQLLARVRSLPRVTSASASTLVPFQAGGFRGTFAEIDGYTAADDEEIRLDYLFVAPDLFRTLGIPLLQGRDFEARDAEGSRPVAIVNRNMAERYWPGRDPLGGIVRFGVENSVDVIGVTGDPVWSSLGEETTPFIFIPIAQSPSVASRSFITLLARTDGNAEQLLPLLAAQFRELEPGLSLTFLRTLEQQVGDALMPQRLGTMLFTLFGVLSLLLAAVGIYGVVGYSVSRQARDIGVRIALGAKKQDILAEVVLGMAVPVVLGLALGTAIALALSGAVETFMFGVDPSDPLTFAAVAVLLAAVAVVAALIPAWRAAQLDPMRVLSTE